MEYLKYEFTNFTFIVNKDIIIKFISKEIDILNINKVNVSPWKNVVSQRWVRLGEVEMVVLRYGRHLLQKRFLRHRGRQPTKYNL